MKDYNLFDILGPIMIGPSSSHTAGACRLGKIAADIAGEGFYSVDFLLHGSFAQTHVGHGTDKALLAGVMGAMPSDESIRNSFHIATEKGLEYKFIEIDLGYVHPNTVRMIFHYADKPDFEIQGSSIGGGNIIITEINGTELEYNGERPTIICKYVDVKGIISRVTSLFAIMGLSIANMNVVRNGKNATFLCEFDGDLDPAIVDDLNRLYDFTFIKCIIPKKEK